jgi:hypothetical protein
MIREKLVLFRINLIFKNRITNQKGIFLLLIDVKFLSQEKVEVSLNCINLMKLIDIQHI